MNRTPSMFQMLYFLPLWGLCSTSVQATELQVWVLRSGLVILQLSCCNQSWWLGLTAIGSEQYVLTLEFPAHQIAVMQTVHSPKTCTPMSQVSVTYNRLTSCCICHSRSVATTLPLQCRPSCSHLSGLKNVHNIGGNGSHAGWRAPKAEASEKKLGRSITGTLPWLLM